MSIALFHEPNHELDAVAVEWVVIGPGEKQIYLRGVAVAFDDATDLVHVFRGDQHVLTAPKALVVVAWRSPYEKATAVPPHYVSSATFTG